MRRLFAFFAIFVAALVGLALAAVLALALVLGSSKGPPLVEKLVNRFGATLETPIRLEGLGGSLWHAPTLGALWVSDGDGVWLTIHGIRAEWSPGALLSGGRPIQSLEADSVVVHRRPLPSVPDETESGSESFRPADVLVYVPQRLSLPSIMVAPAVTGVSHTLRGGISYTDPGLTTLSLTTLNGPATTLHGRVLFTDALTDSPRVSATLALTEQPNGLIGGLLELPATDVSATVMADGALDSLQTDATLSLTQPTRKATVHALGPVDIFAPSATFGISGTFVEGRQAFRLNGDVIATAVSVSVPSFLLTGPGTHANGNVRWQQDPRLVAGSVSATVASLTPFAAFLVPDLKGSFAFSANGKLEGTDLDATADLNRLNLTYQGHAIRLQAPAQAEWSNGRGTLSPLRLSVAGGSLSAEGTFNDEIARGNLTFSNIDVGMLYPNPYLSGRLNGALNLTGTPQKPDLAFSASFAGRSDDHNIRADTTGIWRGELLKLDATASSGPSRFKASTQVGGTLSLLPFNTTLGLQSSLSGNVEGRLPLTMLNPYLWASQQHVEGDVSANLTLAGTLESPRPTGTVRANNVIYNHRPSGICVNGLNAVVVGNETRFTLQSLSAQDKDGGSLQGQGSLSLEGDKPLNATLSFNRYGLFCGGLATGVMGGTLNATGTLADNTLAGTLRLGPLNIQIPGAGPTQKPIPQIETVRAGTKRNNDGAASSRTQLNISIDAPNQIFVRGRGLDAEFGGKLTVGGTTASPNIAGTLAAERGAFVFFDRTLKLGETTLLFEGPIPPSPYINVNASSRVNDNTIGIAMTGPATKPVLQLTSQPSLPQDEILAQLLFGRSLANITPFQAIQLAQAARTLAGLDGGDPGIIGTARSALGLDTLDVGSDTDNNVTVTTGKYLSDDVYLSIQQGAREQDREVRTEIELTPSVSGYTSVNGLGQQTFGVQWKRDY